MTAKIIEKTVPEQITTPIGIQRELPLMIMGTTPTAVVAEVRKIGLLQRRRRRNPALLWEYRLLPVVWMRHAEHWGPE